jgi:hypothetical protein
MCYPFYFVLFVRNGRRTVRQRARAAVIAAIGFMTYVAWSLSAYVMLLITYLAAVEHNALAVAWCMTYLAEYAVAAYVFTELGRLPRIQIIWAPVYAVVHAVPHTLAANWGLGSFLLSGRLRRTVQRHD